MLQFRGLKKNVVFISLVKTWHPCSFTYLVLSDFTYHTPSRWIKMNGKTTEMGSEKKGCVLFLVLCRHAGCVCGGGAGCWQRGTVRHKDSLKLRLHWSHGFWVTKDKWARAKDYSYHSLQELAFRVGSHKPFLHKITQLFPLLYVLVSPSCHVIMDKEYNLLLRFSLWPSLLLYPPLTE